MSLIIIETKIKAPIERVFDLSRSIDLHIQSTEGTNEKVINGKTSGLINKGETVTWRAKHLGVYQNMTVHVTELDQPVLFVDEMIEGTFKSMKHVHRFHSQGGLTIMIDEFEFHSPFGIIGRFVNMIFLKRYMTRFLMKRNEELKVIAEGDRWKSLLNSEDNNN